MQKPTPLTEPVYVTKPAMPPLEKMQSHFEDLWESKMLSNFGQKHVALEASLANILDVPCCKLFNNGTLALTLALKALNIRGEVITTPFTFPATPHAVVWAGAKPVFADIDNQSLCIDPNTIESMITSKTEAILGVHVYGNACDVKAIQAIADRHNLKVIYDAAHAFQTCVDDKPIASFGDLTMFSFHATKLFHTIEGGCLGFTDTLHIPALDRLRNFGLEDRGSVSIPGINAKLNELQCAVGIEMLEILPIECRKRQRIRDAYLHFFSDIEGIDSVVPDQNTSDSLQYMAVRVDQDKFSFSAQQLHEQLKDYNIYTRRYFHPLCTDYDCYQESPRSNLQVAEKVKDQVLCLPLYGDLTDNQLERIFEAISFIAHNPK